MQWLVTTNAHNTFQRIIVEYISCKHIFKTSGWKSKIWEEQDQCHIKSLSTIYLPLYYLSISLQSIYLSTIYLPLYYLSISLVYICLSTIYLSISLQSIYLSTIYLPLYYLSISLLSIYLSTIYLSLYFVSITIYLSQSLLTKFHD